METIKKVLFIDDKKEERQKAEVAIRAARCVTAGAEDFHEALLMLGEYDEARGIECPNLPDLVEQDVVTWDGVITDLHFPTITHGREKSEENDPHGIDILIICQKRGIPCVVCTDVHHHHSAWIKRIAGRLGAVVVDDKGANSQAWEKAVVELRQLINA